MFEAVVFDLDGTLINSMDAIFYSFNKTLTDHGYKGVERSELEKWIGKPVYTYYPFFAEGIGPELVETLTSEFRMHMKNEGMEKVRLYPGVAEALEKLSPVKRALATTKPSVVGVPTLKKFGLNKFFGAVVFGDNVQNPKPAPDLLLLALEELGVGPENCLYVGDSVYDVEMAHNAGAKVCAVTYGYGEKSVLKDADYMIDGLQELEAIVFKQ